MLRNLTAAPDFTLLDDSANEHSLSELHGGKLLVIHFFRGAFCPTARRDLMMYNDVYDRIRTLDANLITISVDTTDDLRRLRHHLGLQYPLLSDLGFIVSQTYGVYRSDETDEGPQPHGEPAVFIVDVQGRIAYSQIQSGPKAHANPAEIVLMLLFMSQNEGRYW